MADTSPRPAPGPSSEPDLPDRIAHDIVSPGDVTAAASRAVTARRLVSGDGLTIDSLKVDVGEARAANNLWSAARAGSLAGTFAAGGWAYGWAYFDITGRFEAGNTVSVTAWRDMAAELVSRGDGVEGFARRTFRGTVTAPYWIDLEVSGAVEGTLTAGDHASDGDVTLRAGGQITATVTATGSVDVACAKGVASDLTAEHGSLDVVANRGVSGRLTAGEDVYVHCGAALAGSVTAAEDISLTVGGAADGVAVVSRGGSVNLHAGGKVTGTIRAAGSVTVETVGSMTAAVRADGPAVLVLANAGAAGTFAAGWTVGVRSARGRVRGTFRTRRRWPERLTHPGSPTHARLARIREELAGRPQDDPAAADLRTEEELHTLRPLRFDPARVPAGRAAALVRAGLAVRVPAAGGSPRVLLADVAGTHGYVCALEGGPAHAFRVVGWASARFAGEPAHFREQALADPVGGWAALARGRSAHPAVRGERVVVQVGLLPLADMFDEAAEGKFWDGGVAMPDPAAWFPGLAAVAARRAWVYAGKRFVRFCGVEGITNGNADILRRRAAGFHTLGGGTTADELGYFGEATLRLLGLPEPAAVWLRTPRPDPGRPAPPDPKPATGVRKQNPDRPPRRNPTSGPPPTHQAEPGT